MIHSWECGRCQYNDNDHPFEPLAVADPDRPWWIPFALSRWLEREGLRWRRK